MRCRDSWWLYSVAYALIVAKRQCRTRNLCIVPSVRGTVKVHAACLGYQ